MPYCDNILSDGSKCGKQCTFKHSITNNDGTQSHRCYKCAGVYASNQKLYRESDRGKEVSMLASRKHYLKVSASKKLLLTSTKGQVEFPVRPTVDNLPSNEYTVSELDTESIISDNEVYLSEPSEIDDVTANERKQVVKQLAYDLMNMGLNQREQSDKSFDNIK